MRFIFIFIFVFIFKYIYIYFYLYVDMYVYIYLRVYGHPQGAYAGTPWCNVVGPIYVDLPLIMTFLLRITLS